MISLRNSVSSTVARSRCRVASSLISLTSVLARSSASFFSIRTSESSSSSPETRFCPTAAAFFWAFPSAASARSLAAVSCRFNSAIVRAESSRSDLSEVNSFSTFSSCLTRCSAVFAAASDRFARSVASVALDSAFANFFLRSIKVFSSCPSLARNFFMLLRWFNSFFDSVWPSSISKAICSSFSASFFSNDAESASFAEARACDAAWLERYLSLDCRASMRSRWAVTSSRWVLLSSSYAWRSAETSSGSLAEALRSKLERDSETEIGVSTREGGSIGVSGLPESSDALGDSFTGMSTLLSSSDCGISFSSAFAASSVAVVAVPLSSSLDSLGGAALSSCADVEALDSDVFESMLVRDVSAPMLGVPVRDGSSDEGLPDRCASVLTALANLSCRRSFVLAREGVRVRPASDQHGAAVGLRGGLPWAASSLLLRCEAWSSSARMVSRRDSRLVTAPCKKEPHPLVDCLGFVGALMSCNWWSLSRRRAGGLAQFPTFVLFHRLRGRQGCRLRLARVFGHAGREKLDWSCGLKTALRLQGPCSEWTRTQTR